jgi:hypothetical protein
MVMTFEDNDEHDTETMQCAGSKDCFVNYTCSW